METKSLYEDRNGFLEMINATLIKELIVTHPELSESDYNDIIFKLAAHAKPMPETDKDLVVFPNGRFDRKIRGLVDTDRLADMGFRDYNYLPPGKENEPVRFMKLLFDNVDGRDIPMIKAGLKSAVSRRLDSCISVIHGLSSVGKSAPLQILCKCLGDYGLILELDQFLEGRFIRAKIENKSLLVLQDLPKTWKNFAVLKAVTGEITKSERGFHSDMKSFDVKLKIWASANYLAKVPSEEKNAMFTSRLSLIRNVRQEPYEKNNTFENNIIEEEGEKIISWILNIPDEDCHYEPSAVVQENWERIASPELYFVRENYEVTSVEGGVSMTTAVLRREFQETTGKEVSMKVLTATLRDEGYIVSYNSIKNITRKKVAPAETKSNGQSTLA